MCERNPHWDISITLNETIYQIVRNWQIRQIAMH